MNILMFCKIINQLSKLKYFEKIRFPFILEKFGIPIQNFISFLHHIKIEKRVKVIKKKSLSRMMKEKINYMVKHFFRACFLCFLYYFKTEEGSILIQLKMEDFLIQFFILYEIYDLNQYNFMLLMLIEETKSKKTSFLENFLEINKRIKNSEISESSCLIYFSKKSALQLKHPQAINNLVKKKFNFLIFKYGFFR